jgi:hypothetical protein
MFDIAELLDVLAFADLILRREFEIRCQTQLMDMV